MTDTPSAANDLYLSLVRVKIDRALAEAAACSTWVFDEWVSRDSGDYHFAMSIPAREPQCPATLP